MTCPHCTNTDGTLMEKLSYTFNNKPVYYCGVCTKTFVPPPQPEKV